MEEIKFTTKTDFQVFRDYWMFTLFEKKGVNGKMNAFSKYMLVLCIVLGAAVVLAVCNYALLDNMMGIVPLILLLAVIAAFASCFITVTQTQPKRQYKLVQAAVESPQKYTFTRFGWKCARTTRKRGAKRSPSSPMTGCRKSTRQEKPFICLSAIRKRS